MTPPDLVRFCNDLRKHNQVGDLRDEALRHEMSATLNRNHLTQQEEGGFSFNTTQLCWIVSSNPGWDATHPLVQALLLSAMIEDRLEIVRDAQVCGVIPASWIWMSWADGFAGDEEELLTKLLALPDLKQRCGAVCFATWKRPRAIGCRLLDEFRLTSLATVYHRLLRRALAAPQANSIAAQEIDRLVDRLEVLFCADTDMTIAALVTASDLAHPELAVAPYKDACADFTATAVARRHLERGRAREALDLVKDLRFLSPAFDQAIIIASLAALECGDLAMCRIYANNIKEQRTRLQVTTRLAQASGDAASELQALVSLATLNPKDGQVFVQLVNLLDRTNHAALARQVCFQAQERFANDPVVAALIQRHAAAAT